MRRAALAFTLAAGLGCLAPALPAPPAPSPAPAERSALPADPQGVVEYVKAAVRDRDEDAFDRLVNWDGVRPLRKRLTLLQIRTTFGRPIKETTLEDFPPDGLAEVEERGTLKLNMPVTKRLRIVFDEADGDPDAPSSNVFLLGQKDGVFRIAVLNSKGPPRN